MRNALQLPNDSVTDSGHFLLLGAIPYTPDTTATILQAPMRHEGRERLESENLGLFFPIIMIIFLVLNFIAIYYSEGWATRGFRRIFFLQEKRNKIGQGSVRMERVAKSFFVVEFFFVVAYLSVEYIVGNTLYMQFFSEVALLQATAAYGLVLLIWILLRFALFEFIGWLYDIVIEMRELESQLYTSSGLLGIVSMLLFFGVEFLSMNLYVAGIFLLFLILLSYIFAIALSFRLFWGRILFFFYLFLYLCAAEIIPGVLIYSILNGFGTRFNF